MCAGRPGIEPKAACTVTFREFQAIRLEYSREYIDLFRWIRKMQTIDLLLAAQVRNLAMDLRSTARAGFYAGIFERMNEEERKRELAAWERAYPLAGFIPVALAEIEQVAAHIRDLLEGPPG